MYTHCVHHFPPPWYQPASGQNLFHPPVLQFCRRKHIKDNKKNMAFLLV
jgi:hypothetical protein